VVTFGFWTFGSWENPWALRALYVWTGLVGNVVVLELWLILGESFTITQAKRIYRVVGAGSVLGAVAGAALARVVSLRMVADDRPLAAAAVMVVTGLGPALLLRHPERTRGSAAGGGTQRMPFSMAHVREQLARQPYVTRLAGLTLVSTIALTLGDYIFK